MSIKHLSGRNFKELFGKDDIPIWKRREYWRSPLALFLIIGLIIFGISYVFFWIVKWLVFSWVAPFFHSQVFCKMGFHKYRKVQEDYCSISFICKVCNKQLIESNLGD